MSDPTEDTQGEARGSTKLVKPVNRDPSAEDERDHFRKQLVRRPWDH